MDSDNCKTIDEFPELIPYLPYRNYAIVGFAIVLSYLISFKLIGIKDTITSLLSLIWIPYLASIYKLFREYEKSSEATRQLNAHRRRVINHNLAVKDNQALRREGERREQQQQAEAQRRLDEIAAQKKRDTDIFFNEYMKFEWERQRRAELVYITAPLLNASWSDYLALADLSPNPFNPEKDFRKYFWERFNDAVGANKNRVDAMRCIHEIDDPLLRQPVAYIKADLPPRWPPLVASPEWARLKNPSIPLDTPMRQMRATFSKPGNLPLYLDTL